MQHSYFATAATATAGCTDAEGVHTRERLVQGRREGEEAHYSQALHCHRPPLEEVMAGPHCGMWAAVYVHCGIWEAGEHAHTQ